MRQLIQRGARTTEIEKEKKNPQWLPKYSMLTKGSNQVSCIINPLVFLFMKKKTGGQNKKFKIKI